MAAINLTEENVDNWNLQRCSYYNWTTRKDGYIQTRIAGTTVLLHRYIVGNPFSEIDHHDGNRHNCHESNLRLATSLQNKQNQKPKKGSSQYKGVYLHSQNFNWNARIRANGKRLHLGCFSSEIEAAKAYDIAALQFHGEFAYLNFPNE